MVLKRFRIGVNTSYGVINHCVTMLFPEFLKIWQCKGVLSYNFPSYKQKQLGKTMQYAHTTARAQQGSFYLDDQLFRLKKLRRDFSNDNSTSFIALVVSGATNCSYFSRRALAMRLIYMSLFICFCTPLAIRMFVV